MYFSMLDLQPDPAMAAQAQALAASVEIADLAALARRLDELAAQPPDEAALASLTRALGSWLGEHLRARVGGAWGVGRLFGEDVPGGLLLGARAIKVWPWHEVRDRIAGRATLSLDARVARLCERAARDDDDDDDDDDDGTDEAPRRYPLLAGEGYFDAGVTRDGRQALMAAFYPATFAIFFAPDGAFIECVERANATPAPDAAALAAWQRELGFTPQPIRVQKFYVAQLGVGIEDLASHDVDFLEDPDSEPEDEHAARFASIRAWVDRGCFVLYWGNDLWLDGTGHVTSS
ncbi:MAG: hypothetical protein JNK64_40905 [Myxococcales bacterium]|nr:hypothetical protein [Myxococcales bacterium]